MNWEGGGEARRETVGGERERRTALVCELVRTLEEDHVREAHGRAGGVRSSARGVSAAFTGRW